MKTMYSALQRTSYFLFISLLVFVPLAFGTVETWSLMVMEICAALSVLLLGISLLSTRSGGLKIPGTVPLFLLLVYMAMQLLPLPVFLVKFLSPATFEYYRPLLDLGPGPDYIPLTLHRKSTLLLLFTFAAYGLVYLLTVYHCSKPDRLKQTAAIVTGLGVIIAVEAILQKLTSPDAIYWFRQTPNSSPVGPWVYSNHFAGYMEMLFPLAIGLFLYHRPRVSYDKTLREKFIATLTMPGANRHLLLGTGAVLMAVSILFSISRGGIITLSLAFLFFTLFSARTTENSRTRWAIVITVLVVVMISWLGWQPIIEKFDRIWKDAELNTSGRLPVLLDSINLFQRFPVFGTGFGTFIQVYPSVRTVPGGSIFDHAHNDYIELLATSGVVGFVLCSWFLLAVFSHAVGMLIRRRDRYAILVTSAALTGVLALLFHSLVDFQVYNGANGLYLFFLCGLAIAAAGTRLHFRSRPTLLTPAGLPALIVTCLFASALLACSSWYKVERIRAERIISSTEPLIINHNQTPLKLENLHAKIALARQLDPLTAEYPAHQGRISILLGKLVRAGREYRRACLIEPASGKYLQQLGLSMAPGERVQKKNLLALGVTRNPLKPSLYFTYSDWLLHTNQRSGAFAVMNRALEKIPWKIPAVIDYMLPYRFTSTEIQQMLADIPAAWYEAGRKMDQIGREAEAKQFYRRAIETAGREEAQPVYFDRLYHLYLKQKNEEKSLEILRQGISYLPDYAPFRIRMGDYYRKEGIIYRAVEEYRQALRLNPRNITVRRRLEELEKS